MKHEPIDIRFSVAQPEENKEFMLYYKDIVFRCVRKGDVIKGTSLLGELHLLTNLQQIIQHDYENETWSKWRYI